MSHNTPLEARCQTIFRPVREAPLDQPTKQEGKAGVNEAVDAPELGLMARCAGIR